MIYKTVDEFDKYINDQLFIGDELVGELAVKHYSDLCGIISLEAGSRSPYLILPLRLCVMHLEERGRIDEAIDLANQYKELLKRHFYIDDIVVISTDLLIARLLKRSKSKAGDGAILANSAADKIRKMLSHVSN